MDIENLLENLQKRGFIPFYFDNEASAIEKIIEIIPNDSIIGFGGSETVKEIGIIPALQENNTCLHRELIKDVPSEELYKKMHIADWYICSTNALTEGGDLVNIDGRANRVAAMLCGPKNVLIVCGINKIVKDIEEGILRTRNIAAVKNVARLNKNTPCAKSGECCYCDSPDTICKATVIQHHPCTGSKVYIMIINTNLGY